MAASERRWGSSHLEGSHQVNPRFQHSCRPQQRGHGMLCKRRECHLVVERTQRKATVCPLVSIQNIGRHILFLWHFKNLMQNVCSNTYFSFCPCRVCFTQLMGNNVSQPQLSEQLTLVALCLRFFCHCHEIQWPQHHPDSSGVKRELYRIKGWLKLYLLVERCPLEDQDLCISE